jgi:hypothetical protein
MNRLLVRRLKALERNLVVPERSKEQSEEFMRNLQLVLEKAEREPWLRPYVDALFEDMAKASVRDSGAPRTSQCSARRAHGWEPESSPPP